MISALQLANFLVYLFRAELGWHVIDCSVVLVYLKPHHIHKVSNHYQVRYHFILFAAFFYS